MSLQPFLLYKIELFAVDILLIVFNKFYASVSYKYVEIQYTHIYRQVQGEYHNSTRF